MLVQRLAQGEFGVIPGLGSFIYSLARSPSDCWNNFAYEYSDFLAEISQPRERYDVIIRMELKHLQQMIQNVQLLDYLKEGSYRHKTHNHECGFQICVTVILCSWSYVLI